MQRFREFVADPSSRALVFKKIGGTSNVWSVRIDDNYRALGKRGADVITWFFVGDHTEYERTIGAR